MYRHIHIHLYISTFSSIKTRLGPQQRTGISSQKVTGDICVRAPPHGASHRFAPIAHMTLYSLNRYIPKALLSVKCLVVDVSMRTCRQRRRVRVL